MATIIFGNFINTQLAGPISNTATLANLQSGGGALFPTILAGEYLVAILNDANTGLDYEIIHVTNVTGDTITIVRGQEGTSALAWAAGDLLFSGITAGQMTNFVQQSYVQQQPGNYAADTGTANAYVVALTPALTTHTVGLPIRVKFANANTGASTLDPGPGAASITHDDGSALIAGDIVAGMIATVIYSGGSYILQRNRFSTAAQVKTGTDDNSAVTPAALSGEGMGSWQNLANVISLRNLNTTYTNTFNRPIVVYINLNVGSGQANSFLLNGVQIGVLNNVGTSTTQISGSWIVPPGATYEVQNIGGSSITNWYEYQ